MITKKTVFVLGAGVSMPYGFPSGNRLVEHICAATMSSNFQGPPDDSRYLMSREDIGKILLNEFGKKQVEEFGVALYLSHQVSIDAFLEHRPEFTEIGKVAIALFILRKEMEVDLVKFENRTTGCYQYLFSRLNTKWSEFNQNQVSFVTFNYDRSLEQFLFTSLKNSYNKSDKECADLINQIPIIHVHGSLGKLDWQDTSGIPFGTLKNNSIFNKFLFNPGAALEAAKKITVISEDQSTSKEFQNAFQLLAQAEQIYFLGFSYHAINMKRLSLIDIPRFSNFRGNKLDITHMVGTGYKMEDAEINSVKNRWHVKIPDNTSDSVMFLKKYARLE